MMVQVLGTCLPYGIQRVQIPAVLIILDVPHIWNRPFIIMKP